MPRVKLFQPQTLYQMALPIISNRIHNHCTSILRYHEDVTRATTNQQQLSDYNDRLVKEIPRTILEDLIRYNDLSQILSFDTPSCKIDRIIFKNDYFYKHFTAYVCPRLKNVTVMILSSVEGSFDLFQAVSNCQHLKEIVVDTKLVGNNRIHNGCLNCGQDWTIWLMLLTNCKKLEIIYDVSDTTYGFSVLNDQMSCHRFIVGRLLRDLPALKVFNYVGLFKILLTPEMQSQKYHLTRIYVGNNYFVMPEDVYWLNIHCPHIKEVTWRVCDTNDYAPVLAVLADETDLKLESLVFTRGLPTINEALHSALMKKGKYLHTLYITYDCYISEIPDTALSFKHIVNISKFCNALKNLKLAGSWFKGNALTLEQRRVTNLFPNLEYFNFYNTSHTCRAIPTLLREIKMLDTCFCTLIGCDVNDFLTVLESVRNDFIKLKKFSVLVEQPIQGALLMFIQRLISIGLKWPVVEEINIYVSDNLSWDVHQYVTEVGNQIKKQQLDVFVRISCV